MSSDVKQLCSEKSNTFAGAVYLIHYNLRAEKSERKGAHENRAYLGGRVQYPERNLSPRQQPSAALGCSKKVSPPPAFCCLETIPTGTPEDKTIRYLKGRCLLAKQEMHSAAEKARRFGAQSPFSKSALQQIFTE